MHATLGLQEAKSILSDDFERGGACAHVITRFMIDELDFISTALAPALIHPHQHVRPVTGLRATGTGMDGDEGIATVKRPAQQLAKFKAGNISPELFVLLLHFTPRVCVARLFGQLNQSIKITNTRFQILKRFDLLFDDVRAVDRLARSIRVIPEARGRQAVLQHGQFVF